MEFPEDIEQRSIRTIRALALDQVQAARSGHVGFPLGAAPLIHTVYAHYLRSDPTAPEWLNRDRFVLSAGHGSAMLYATLHLAGYAVSTDDLRAFRQWGSITPGHPEHGPTPGVDATTGPLGQGIANAVGMAIAERMTGARLTAADGPLLDHRTFVLASDGDFMEGIALEAVAFAGLHRLGKLVVLYDDNDIVIDGRASHVHDAAAVARAAEAHGWHTVEVADGDDLPALRAALDAAVAETERPSLVRVRTVIGRTSPLADDPRAHSGALSEADDAATRAALGPDHAEPFHVPEDVAAWWGRFAERGGDARAEWLRRMAADDPAIATFHEWVAGGADPGIDVREFEGATEAARMTSGKVMARLAETMPTLVGGAADLVAATMADLPNGGTFSPDEPAGRNISFGVREHAMGAIVNGIALHGVLRPFASTFLVFTTYQANALRMAALQELPVIHVLSHDSITVGEDGPTHQPVEMLSTLRATPNTVVLRPGDAREAAECWQDALARTDGPSILVLSRSPLEPADRSDSWGETRKGAYIVSGTTTADLVLVASGSELAPAHSAAELLRAEGLRVRVVSAPSHELFFAQPDEYRDTVLPPETPRLVIEASHPLSLWRLAGPLGDVVGVDRFGASAPPERMLAEYGFTPDQIAARGRAHLARLADRGQGAPVAEPVA